MNLDNELAEVFENIDEVPSEKVSSVTDFSNAPKYITRIAHNN